MGDFQLIFRCGIVGLHNKVILIEKIRRKSGHRCDIQPGTGAVGLDKKLTWQYLVLLVANTWNTRLPVLAGVRTPPPGDPAADPRRVDYLARHFAAAARAVADGVPLQGFFVWSFLDNFEWNQGFARRFGLFHVDYRTLRRSPRRSAHWYRAWLSAGANAATADPSTTRSTP